MRYGYSFDYRSKNNGFEGPQLGSVAALNFELAILQRDLNYDATAVSAWHHTCAQTPRKLGPHCPRVSHGSLAPDL